MQRKKLISFIIALVFSISLIPIIKANAETKITDEQVENIESNCSSIKSTLKRVQNSDKNSRVSLGRSFQTITSDFITPLNVRLVKNNQFNNTLADIQNNIIGLREEFNRSYIEYSQDLESLININCSENAKDFYHQLDVTRKKREKVLKTAKKLEEIIDKHIESVKDMKKSFEKGNSND